MVLTAVVLWVGVPFGWLWVGSQVQGATGSIGLALLTMAIGVAVSIALLMRLMGWLNLQHIHAASAAGSRPTATPRSRA